MVGYPNAFTPMLALRPQLKFEVTFLSPSLPVEDRPFRSLVAQARDEAPEVTAIACVSPVETAAEKLSAPTWRVLSRKRDDPAMIRQSPRPFWRLLKTTSWTIPSSLDFCTSSLPRTLFNISALAKRVNLHHGQVPRVERSVRHLIDTMKAWV